MTKIEVDEISLKFIKTALVFQNESGVIFDTHNYLTEKEFKADYGFTKKQLNKSLSSLRSQLGEQTAREKLNNMTPVELPSK